MKTIYMYQTEDGLTYTSDDKPTLCDEMCCDQGVLRIFRMMADTTNNEKITVIVLQELLGGEKWQQVPGSDIKLEDPNDTDSRPFHYPRESGHASRD